ncbi:MAG: peptidase M23 [Desulfuromonas sp.]|nr:MAG: peptidase M23 [Desulfuromonas sp.]
MKKLTVLAVLFTALLYGTSAIAEVRLTPSSLPVGGVTWVEWRGERPAYVMARWQDKVIYLHPVGQAWRAMIGADVGLAPGSYPLPLSVVFPDGEILTESLAVRVTAVQFPEERLTLPEKMVSPRSEEVISRISRERRRLDKLYEDYGGSLEVLPWILPVDDEIGSRFGRRRILNGKPRSPHGGVDFRSGAGTSILAPGSGEVVLADDLFFTGRTVLIDHGAGLYSVYAHLSRIDCQVGETVKRGARLGAVGSSGRATGPHLHWGVRLHGARVDPLQVVNLLSGEKP